MADGARDQPVQRLLVVMPTWLGDCVMATPLLRALRHLYPAAHIKALVAKNIRAILDATPWIDAFVTVRDRADGPLRLSRRLALGRFDAAVLLPNSFRTAVIMAMAGIGRRIGYQRDGRGLLLTDRLIPPKRNGHFVPVPAVEYYLDIAHYLGATDVEPSMQLFSRQEDDDAANHLLDRAKLNRPDKSFQPLVLLNPGAQKVVKRWPTDHFAQVAERCSESFGAMVAVTGAPGEYPVLKAVTQAARVPVINLLDHGLNLRLLKSIIRRTSLLITNDTGPRHIAAAMGTPVVTLFGPTAPQWTEIGFADERQIVAPLTRSSRRVKPDRSMASITVDAVFEKSAELLQLRAGAQM